MESYEWMVRSTAQTEWIERRGLLIWLAEAFNGLGAGLYLVSLYFNSFTGMLLSWFVLVLLKGGLHFAYLGKPLRFWRMMLKPQTSWLARGFIFLGVFICCGAVQLLISHWLPGTTLEYVFKIIAGAAVFLVLVYPGFALNSVNAIPLWNSAVLPLLFVVVGALDGFGLVFLIGLYGGGIDTGAAKTGVQVMLFVNALFIIIYLWSTTYTGLTGKRSVMEMISGRVAPVLWVGVVLCGVIVPVVISLSSHFLGDAPSAVILVLGVACEMIGAFSLKYAILKSALYGPLVPTPARG